jgi:O-antigen/teichoic acid export membrane protein
MLLRQTILYLPAQILAPLFQLVSVIVWTHVINEHALGVITLVTASHELLQAVFLTWWSQYALRFLGRFLNGEDAARFHRTENAVLLASVLGQSAISAVILLTVIAPDADATLITATVAYVATRTLNLYIGERARVHQNIVVYSIQQITGPVLGFGLGLAMIEAFGQGPEWPLAGYAVAQIGAVIAVLPMIAVGRSVGPVDRAIIGHALRYGIPLIIGGVLGWLGLNASRFILNDMLDVAAAGLFAVGYGLGQRAAAVAAMLVTAGAFPLAVAQMERGGSRMAMRQLADNGALVAAILLPSVVGIFALREELIRLLIAEPFRDVTLAILPLSALAGAIRNFRAHFGDQVFLLQNRTWLSVVVAGIEGVLTVGLSVPSISMWGIVGAALASVGATAIAAIASFAIGLSVFELRLPWAHFGRIVLATLVMAAGLRVLPPAGRQVALLLHVMAGVALYAATLAVLYMPTLVDMIRLRAKDTAGERWSGP